MFSEPLLAHPAETGGVGASWHPHPADDADRDQYDADADHQEHMGVAAMSRMAILTRGYVTVCAVVHNAPGLCIREQRNCEAGAYTRNMQLLSIKPIIAMLWVSAAFVIGIAGNVESFSGRTLLASIAVVPPLVMIWRWNDPGQTMSESIQEALR
jgi:hypothetical protein